MQCQMMGVLFAVVARLTAAAQTSQPDAHMKSYRVFAFNASTTVFTTPTAVAVGGWVELRMTCQTGQYIQDCGVPEFYSLQTGYRLQFICGTPWTVGATTEEVCGVVATETGAFNIYIPVLQQYILYEGSYEVVAGPGSM